MNWLDPVIVLFIAGGVFRGVGRGLVREGMAFAGLAVGLVAAAQWYSEVVGFLRPFVGGGRLAEVLAYFLILLLVLGVATLITVGLLRLKGFFLIRWLDRLGGAAFGGAQGALLAAAVVVLLVRNPIANLDQAVHGSALAAALLQAVGAAVVYLPPELAPVAAFFRLPNLP